MNVGRSLLADGLDPDPKLFLAGLGDALTEKPLRVSEEELAAALREAAVRVRQIAAERRAAASRTDLKRFETLDTTTILSTGESVRFETTGTGPKPTATGRVRLHYAASVAGEEAPFFTTRRANAAGEPVGEPFEVAVEELLPGLRTVLPDVPAGSTALVGLPPDRGYGPAGGPGVPPNAALLVRVELLAVLPSPAAATDPEAAAPLSASGPVESGPVKEETP